MNDVAKLLGMHLGEPLHDTLDRLTEAASHLLVDHDCDAHGHEVVRGAMLRGREYADKLRAYLTAENARPRFKLLDILQHLAEPGDNYLVHFRRTSWPMASYVTVAADGNTIHFINTEARVRQGWSPDVEDLRADDWTMSDLAADLMALRED